MKLWKDISFRTIATIVLKVSTTGGGASLLGANRPLAFALAAWVGIMEVAEEMSKAYLDDGEITKAELNAASKRIIETAEKAKK
jgi:hypothetical protein